MRPAYLRSHSPAEVARNVVASLNLGEEVGLLGLWSGWHGYENSNDPVGCIPRLTLSDGSQGVSFDTSGMTQLPAPLGLGATFSAALAEQYGADLGTEAYDDGLDVLQAPDLNLVRVPDSGRAFETLGEDPVLTGDLAAAEVDGIASEGVIAEPKHLGVYTQETDRPYLDQVVAERTLQEVYLAPFQQAFEQAGALAVMCAYGEIDGTPTCEDPDLYRALSAWGFSGIVRSDQFAVPTSGTITSYEAGLDLLKPAQPQLLEEAVEDGQLTRSVLDGAVERVIATMDQAGVLATPRVRDRRSLVAAHLPAAVLSLTEDTMVLLKRTDGVLPLGTSSGTIAVIGADGGTDPVSSGLGSAYVVGEPSSPATALATALPGQTTYTPAAPATPVTTLFSVASPGTVTADPAQPPGSPVQDASTATTPQGGPGWSIAEASFTAPASGTYVVDMTSDGDAFLDGPGGEVLGDAGAQEQWTDSGSVQLSAGESVQLSLDWASSTYPEPLVTLEDATPAIEEASAAARQARTAVVFAGVPESEGMDRQTLALPGDEDQMIEAVAAANPRTVVVVNSGGAVLMPWLGAVKAVLEAWYPGVDDGTATAAVLDGTVDPAGHLPVTFPASDATSATASHVTFPGEDGTVVIDGDGQNGLDIGYRWYQANDVAPLFPFGFGLSYTSFSLSRLGVRRRDGAVVAAVRLRDTGRRAGTEVVQAYLSYPLAAGEPPEELKAFDAVQLAPGRSATVELSLPVSAFEIYTGGRFSIEPGRYELRVGTSSTSLPLSAGITVAASPSGPTGPSAASGATGASGPRQPTGASGPTGSLQPTGSSGSLQPTGATASSGSLQPTGAAQVLSDRSS